jgi:hypothetical protein
MVMTMSAEPVASGAGTNRTITLAPAAKPLGGVALNVLPPSVLYMNVPARAPGGNVAVTVIVWPLSSS